MNPLKSLWTSTEHLHNRFHLVLTTRARLGKFEEEVLEFIEEACPSTNDASLVEEAADVMVTLFGVLMARQISFYKLEQAIDHVVRKNNAKSLETHHVIDGLIKRK